MAKNNKTDDEKKQITKSFSEGKIKTTIKASKDDEGKPWGVFAQTENVHTEKYSKHHKGVWVPANAFLRWFNKFKRIISNIFENFYGEKLVFSEDDVKREKNKIETLQEELDQQRTKYKEMEQVYLKQQEKIKLAEETKEEASYYENILDKFNKDVEDSISNNKNIENDVRKELKENRWILGLDCEIKATNKDIDPKSEIDLHIISELGEEKVFEIKSPNKKLFVDKNDTYLRISLELSEAISQLVNYLRKTDIYSQINEKGNYKIYKGKGIILMDKNLNQEEQKFRKDLNFHLRPHIQIITFDELISNAKNEIAIIKEAKKKKF